MIKLVLSEVVQAINGRPRGELPTLSVRGVSTDSRSITQGDLFIAIPGPRFDGHTFVGDVLQAGAAAAVIAASRGEEVEQLVRERLGRPVPPGVLIEVNDTVAALGALAAYHRGLLSAEVIGVVGSNGKTTTKAMIHHILGGRMRGRCSPKSFNNEIGVPVTLLSAEGADEYLVVEIGTNAPGEVAALAELARPDMVVLTCIAEEHLEKLRDLRGVAEEECSVFAKVKPGGFAAVNVESPLVRPLLPEVGLTIATFGRTADADIRLTDVRYDAPWLNFLINERFPYRLRLAGAHNAINAAGAITIARRLGFDHAEIAARLESFIAPPMRNEVIEAGGVMLINDAYNANPGSTLAALDVLESLPCRGRRIAVLGEMCELGGKAAELHKRVAQRLVSGKVDSIFLVGTADALMADVLRDGQLFAPPVVHCPDVSACTDMLQQELRDGDVVLLKASRAVGLDRVVEPLRRRFAQAAVV